MLSVAGSSPPCSARDDSEGTDDSAGFDIRSTLHGIEFYVAAEVLCARGCFLEAGWFRKLADAGGESMGFHRRRLRRDSLLRHSIVQGVEWWVRRSAVGDLPVEFDRVQSMLLLKFKQSDPRPARHVRLQVRPIM